jgi:hypothetical protein
VQRWAIDSLIRTAQIKSTPFRWFDVANHLVSAYQQNSQN